MKVWRIASIHPVSQGEMEMGSLTHPGGDHFGWDHYFIDTRDLFAYTLAIQHNIFLTHAA
jgi:hypothetical protein